VKSPEQEADLALDWVLDMIRTTPEIERIKMSPGSEVVRLFALRDGSDQQIGDIPLEPYLRVLTHLRARASIPEHADSGTIHFRPSDAFKAYAASQLARLRQAMGDAAPPARAARSEPDEVRLKVRLVTTPLGTEATLSR